MGGKSRPPSPLRTSAGGGEIVAAGTPEDIVAEKRSYTGVFLKAVLASAGQAVVTAAE